MAYLAAIDRPWKGFRARFEPIRCLYQPLGSAPEELR